MTWSVHMKENSWQKIVMEKGSVPLLSFCLKGTPSKSGMSAVGHSDEGKEPHFPR